MTGIDRVDGPRWVGGRALWQGHTRAGAQGKRDQQQTLREDHVECVHTKNGLNGLYITRAHI